MATNTTNFGLKKPAYSDTADIADINGNMDKVDVSLNGLADAIAIVANNNTHVAITAGQFVYVHGHGSLAEGLYTAKSNIAANATLSTSNLQADGSGGLNAFKVGNYITNTNLSPTISNIDLHSLNEPGRYYIGNGCTNLPSGCTHGYIDVYVYLANVGNEYKKLVVYDYSSAKSWTQCCSGGTWGSWEETVKITDRVLIDRNTSSTLSDCNEVTQAGMYRVISSTANKPSNISYGVLVHLMSNDYVVQFMIGTNGVFASRGKVAGSWGSWQ